MESLVTPSRMRRTRDSLPKPGGCRVKAPRRDSALRRSVRLNASVTGLENHSSLGAVNAACGLVAMEKLNIALKNCHGIREPDATLTFGEDRRSVNH
jgi:hypothetical protein